VYYPRVGEDNHGGQPQRLGVWVDGHLEWLGDAGWRLEMRYMDDATVTRVVVQNDNLGLRLEFNDGVDAESDLFVRRIRIVNLRDHQRDVRLFVGTSLHIRESDWANTAYYDPRLDAVVHYKRDLWFARGGHSGQAYGRLTNYTTGKCAPNGEWGCWQDAWDGKLEQVSITQGTVDSCIQIDVPLEGHSSGYAAIWLAAARDFQGLRRTVEKLAAAGVDAILQRTAEHGRKSLNRTHDLSTSLGEQWNRLYRRSLLLTQTQIDHDGAILAGTDSDILQFGRDTYAYLWPRDGALVAHALGRAGFHDEAAAYFRFCEKLITPEGWFHHKYTPGGLPGSSWHPWVYQGKEQLAVQEDETALMVWSLWHHWRLSGDDALLRDLYEPLVRRPAEWMLEFRRRSFLPASSYDLWEERRGIHAFTVGSVIGAFDGAAALARVFGTAADADRFAEAARVMREAAEKHLYRPEWGRFARMLTKPDRNGEYMADPAIDAALFGLFAFGAFPADDPRIVRTMQAVEEKLRCHTVVGGYARYQDDYYQQVSKEIDKVPGNPWIISTLWIAQWYLAMPQGRKRAEEIIQWVTERALPSGVLAEQIHPYTAEPLSVSPLTWSHATLVLAMLDYAGIGSTVVTSV
jgi:GH15 family glucan-1,4-alpha-glucosidase